MNTLRWINPGAGRRRRPAPEPTHARPGTAWPFTNAIVCSGGGNLGAAQVGMLSVLFDAGVRPDLLVGCSVGALNATFIAVDPTPERVADLEALWRSPAIAEVFSGNRRSLATHLLRRADHLYEPDGLRALIARCLAISDLSQTVVPVQVVTTVLDTGTPAWWSSGDPVEVLAASSCLPGLFPPVRLGGHLHVDGGVLCPVPAARALDLGAQNVWVLDVSGDRPPVLPARPCALDVLVASFTIARRALVAAEDRPARPGQRVIRIAVGGPANLDVRDLSRTPALIAEGARAARLVLSEAFGAGALAG